jgi:hypothetical protein
MVETHFFKEEMFVMKFVGYCLLNMCSAEKLPLVGKTSRVSA